MATIDTIDPSSMGITDPNAALKAAGKGNIEVLDPSSFGIGQPEPSLANRLLTKGAMGLTNVLEHGGGAVGAAEALMGQPKPSEIEPTAKGVVKQEVEPLTDVGLMTAGAVAGGMSPVLPGVGATAGGALGAAAATRLDDYVNSYLFGDAVPPASQPGTIPGFGFQGGRLAQSGALGAAAEGIPRAAGWSMANLFGATSAATAAKTAAAEQAAINAHDLDVLEQSGLKGQEKFRGKVWEAEQTAQERAKAQTEAELGKLSEKHAAEQKELAKVAEAQAEKEHAAKTEIARGRLLGRTREESAKALAKEGVLVKPGVVRASPEELARKEAYTGSVFEQVDKIKGDYQDEYQKFEDEHGGKNIPKPTHLADGITAAEAKLPKVGEPGGRSAQITNLIKAARAVASGKTYVEHTDPETGLSAIEEAETIGGPTVHTMRQLRRFAQRVASGTTNTVEASAADDIANGSDRALEQATGLPLDKVKDLRNLNREYFDFNQHFDRAFLKKIHSEPEPTDTFKQFFQEDKARANRLLRAANPEQLRTYQDMAADHFNNPHQPGGEWSLKKIYNEMDHSVLKNLYGDRFTEAMPFAADNVNEFQRVVATNGVVAHDFGQRWLNNIKEIKKGQWIELRKEGMDIAKNMGPAGQALHDELYNAMNQADTMKVVEKFANMPMQDFIKTAAAAQKTPLASARDALLTSKPSELLRAATRFTRFRALFYTAAFMGELAAGHVSPTIEGLAAITAAMAIPVGTGFAGRMVLRNRVMADIFARAVMDPTSANMARASADLIAAAAAQRAKEKVKQMEAAEGTAVTP